MNKTLLPTQEILRRFRAFKLSRGKIFYMEKYAGVKKMQTVEKGRVKNYYNPDQIERVLKMRQRKKRSVPLARAY